MNERLKKELNTLEQLKMNIVLTDLLYIIARFSEMNQEPSTSTIGNTFDTSRLEGADVKMIRSSMVSEIFGNSLYIDKTSEKLIKMWATIMRTNWIPLNPELHESKGIHPAVRQMIQVLLDNLSPQIYCLAHEKSLGDGSNKPRNTHVVPDFGILSKDMESKSNDGYGLCDLFIPIECKKYSAGIALGLRQSMGYAMNRILYQMEIRRDFMGSYSCFCFATDGNMLAIGKVVIIEAQVSILATLDPSFYLPLRNKNPRDKKTIPTGLLALYYILSLSPEDLGMISHRFDLKVNNRVVYNVTRFWAWVAFVLYSRLV